MSDERSKSLVRLCSPATLITRVLVISLTLAVFWVAPPQAEGGQRHRYRWWQSGEIKAALQITDKQSTAIEDIFASTIPALRALANTLELEEHELSQHIADMNVAEWELTLQIDKVEAARSALSKKRILMLYHMRKELTPQQLSELRVIEKRQREERDQQERDQKNNGASPCR